jgi:hypothetical protein
MSFAAPSAVLDGLAPALTDLRNLLPDLKGDDQEPDPMGYISERKVHTMLAFHRLLANLLPHSNWLGLIEDSEDPIMLDVPAVGTAPSTSKATSEPFPLTSRAWDLPRLPIVRSDGRLKDIAAVRRSITYSDSNVSKSSKVDKPLGEDSAVDMDGEHDMPQRKVRGRGRGRPRKKPNAEKDDTKCLCPPELLGQFLSSLSSTEYNAFSTGSHSSSGDFIVRYLVNVTHLQVKHTEPLNFLTFLEECSKVAPTANASSELHHTIAFVIMRPDARAETVQEIGSLSIEKLVEELEVALEKWKAPEGKMGQLKEKSMRLAIDMIKEGTLKVVILNDDQYNRFSRYRDLAKHFT